MKKMYFGAWQNFYHVGWPVRFLLEGIIFLLAVFLLYKLIKKIGRILRLPTLLTAGSVWIGTEINYLVGKNNPRALEMDYKIIEWGEKRLNGGMREKTVKKCRAIKFWAGIGIIFIYISAVFVDLPISGCLKKEYLDEFVNIKAFFQEYEQTISKGYEKYPPLFVKREPEKVEEEPARAVVEKEEIPVYIQLNETGRNGANVRMEPSLDGEIVGGVNEKMEVLFRNQWELDDDGRYWIKVFIVSADTEGWLSGKLVDSVQLETLINETEHQ